VVVGWGRVEGGDENNILEYHPIFLFPNTYLLISVKRSPPPPHQPHVTKTPFTSLILPKPALCLPDPLDQQLDGTLYDFRGCKYAQTTRQTTKA